MMKQEMIFKMMTKENFVEKYHDLNNNPGQILLDSKYVINLYITNNFQNNKTFIIITNNNIEMIKSSKAINVSMYQKENGSKVIIFQLIDKDLSTEFIELLWNIYHDTYHFDDESKAVDSFFQSFLRWQIMLESKELYLSESEIKGLFGELCFLHDYSNIYGVNKMINSWMVDVDTETDFSFDNIWYEIKTISRSKNYINITSVNQLDQQCNGILIIHELQKGETKSSKNLNSLVKSIRNLITDKDNLELFNSKLLKKRYVDSTFYDTFNYEIIERKQYDVNDTFPCIRRNNLNNAVKSVQYELYINAIDKWRIL